MGNVVFTVLARIKTTLPLEQVYKMLTQLPKLLAGQSKEHVDEMLFYRKLLACVKLII